MDLGTTTLLLNNLHDARNDEAWREFDDAYRPVLTAFARRLGLDPSRAADVAQDTLTRFFEEYRAGRYDRDRGRLRSWIIGIARCRIADVYRAQARRREVRGESAILDISDDATLTGIWAVEEQRDLLCRALVELQRSTRIRRQTLDAFRRQVIEQKTAQQVADELGLTIQAVYMAKHHCLDRMRAIVASLRAARELD